jgi:hypothetical protein
MEPPCSSVSRCAGNRLVTKYLYTTCISSGSRPLLEGHNVTTDFHINNGNNIVVQQAQQKKTHVSEIFSCSSSQNQSNGLCTHQTNWSLYRNAVYFTWANVASIRLTKHWTRRKVCLSRGRNWIPWNMSRISEWFSFSVSKYWNKQLHRNVTIFNLNLQITVLFSSGCLLCRVTS